MGAVLYRPLIFWADNAWDLAAPQDMLTTVIIELLVALGVFAIALRASGRAIASAFVVGAVVFAILDWGSIDEPVPFLVFAAVAMAVVTVSLRATAEAARKTALIVIAITLVVPIFQLVASHVQKSKAYPLITVESPTDAVATGQIEDIVVVVVDGYPMAWIAESWFGHDMEPIRSKLGAEGFTTPSVSWSHNTFTSVALPTLLQLTQVVDTTADQDWQNQRTNHAVLRGENFTAGALRTAGFDYIHIESGWNGDICGRADVCLDSSWPDEINWQLLGASALGPVMESRWASQNVGNSKTVVDQLVSLDVFDDGRHDFVYAHMMLPHSPFVVDEECILRPPVERIDTEDPDNVSSQLACVDGMLARIVDRVGPNTAIMIIGDHGTATRDQLSRDTSEWTDADIAERLGAFLSYRMPPDCTGPEMATNMLTLRAIVACAIQVELPSSEPGFVIGLRSVEPVSRSTVTQIGERLVDGVISRSD